MSMYNDVRLYGTCREKSRLINKVLVAELSPLTSSRHSNNNLGERYVQRNYLYAVFLYH
jgi:hypothetical protein